jgi:uncharacterized protein YlaI
MELYCIFCGSKYFLEDDSDPDSAKSYFFNNIFTCNKCRHRKISLGEIKDRHFLYSEFKRIVVFNDYKCKLCEKTYSEDNLHCIPLFSKQSKMFATLCDDCYKDYKGVSNKTRYALERIFFRDICRCGGKSLLTIEEYEEYIFGKNIRYR